jgi:hypothetical protein
MKKKAAAKRKRSSASTKWGTGLAAAALLAVAIAYGFQGNRSGVSRTSPFNADRALGDLKTIVGFGPRPAGSEALAKTRVYIAAELEKAGLKAQLDEFEVTTPRGRKRMTNIRAVRAGSRPTTIALAGHYDTKLFDFRFEGANDGGSSAAWVLEMARATRDLKLENSLEFVFFDGEEAVGTPETVRNRTDWTDTDSLYGSRYDVDRRNRNGTLRQLKALILVDMIGDKSLNIEQESDSTDWLKSTIWGAARAAGYTREFPTTERAISDDHVPFLRAGIPAVDLIDFDYGPGHSYWHQPADTLDKTSGQSLKIVGDVIYMSLPEIDRRVSQNN